MAYFFQLPLITDLTEDQQMALDEVNPIAISGGAGTGKTVVSLWRHIQNIDVLNKSSMITTYTKTLHSYLLNSAKSLSNEAWKYIWTSQVIYTHGGNWKIDEILIDEAQDLTFEHLHNMKNYAKHISYGADFNQQLYDGRVKEDEIKNLFPKNIEYFLQQNFRNSYYILNFVKGILPELHIPQSTLDELEYENIGLKPIMFISNNLDKEIEKIIELINEFTSDTHNIAILLPFGKSGDESVENYHTLLSNKNINCSKYYNEMHIDNVEISNIHITTYKSAKGLEFDTVIIPYIYKLKDFTKRNKVTRVNEEDYYVAFTRSKTNLYLLSSEKLDFIDNSICEIEFLENNHYNKVSVPAIEIDEDEIPF
jgi:superfamily I DNA/RNA helicase